MLLGLRPKASHKRKGLMEEPYKNKPGLLHKIHAMLISALIMHVWLVWECLEGVNSAVCA
ncbi:hypothetical protein LB504_006897 [Fusarium proliferatum]|nr:hypothetical protein LB504_006897 [Fusarium proliferatum]